MKTFWCFRKARLTALMLVIGQARGEPFDPLTWPQSQDAFRAWLYLIIFGSLAALSTRSMSVTGTNSS